MNVFEQIKQKCLKRKIGRSSFMEFLEVLDEVEKEHNNGWTTCSERLPKYDEEYFEKHNNNRQYIVMCKDSYAPTVAYFSKEKTWYYDDFVKFNNVIAWQPLPELYKEREKE